MIMVCLPDQFRWKKERNNKILGLDNTGLLSAILDYFYLIISSFRFFSTSKYVSCVTIVSYMKVILT